MESARTNIKAISLIACLTLVISAMCCCTNNKSNSSTTVKETADEAIPFTYLDEKPLFYGQEPNNFVNWVYTQIKLPERVKEDNIEGKVLISFVIDTLGKVTDVKVVEGIDEEIDAEIVRAISSSPDWTPGVKDSVKTACTIKFPVTFQKNQQ